MPSESHTPSVWTLYRDPRVAVMLPLGFSAGLPILLIFSSLSLWLREAGVERSTVTMFSWAALAYSFKFIWSPLVSVLPLPLLGHRLGQRRSWLLLSQILVVLAIAAMAAVDPAQADALPYMAAAAVLLGFSSATQDIVIDAYRIERAAGDEAALSASAATYNAGYKLGTIVAGAGALYLAHWFGSQKGAYRYEAWQQTYWLMALVMLSGVLTTLCIREPQTAANGTPQRTVRDHLRLLLLFAVSATAFVAVFRIIGPLLPDTQNMGALGALGWESLRLGGALAAAAAAAAVLVACRAVPAYLALETWVSPVSEFFRRYGRPALLLLALIGLYRIADVVAGVVSNMFYEDLGFTKTEIANAVKVFGVALALAGGFLGGVLVQKFSLMKMMAAGALMAAATNLLFVLLAHNGRNLTMLYLAVGLDNLASGLAGAVFIAFLSALTSIRFTTVQYAIFSSLMTLLPKTVGGYSGAIVERIGYADFFSLTALMGLPVLLLVYLTDRLIWRRQS